MAIPAGDAKDSILEIAEIRVKPGQEAAFEAAMSQASRVLQTAKGFQSMALNRVLERPDEYRLLVRWDSMDDHMTGFQKSDLFRQWRALLSPFFEATPLVSHSIEVLALP